MRKANEELIIFADDNRLLRMLTEESLLDLGYRVLVAADGEEAIHLFEQHRNEIALAILDIVMPIIDGPSTASKIRLLNNQLPIIFVTGKERNDSLKAIREIENCVVLYKPYSPEKLNEVMRKILD